MKSAGTLLRLALGGAAIVAALGAAYKVGYRAGLRDRGPQHRALVVVRRTKGNPHSSGASATWFDVNKPEDAMRLRKEDARLTALGVEHYVAKAKIVTEMSPEPDPRRVDSHR